MSIVLPVLFAATALFAVAAMWNAIVSNLDAVRDLRRRVAMPSYGSEVVVNFREAELDLDPVATMRRSRQMRHPLPKPITHRLHHFVKDRTAA